MSLFEPPVEYILRRNLLNMTSLGCIVLWNHIYNSNILFSEVIKNSNFDYEKVLDIGNPKLWDIIPLILYFEFKMSILYYIIICIKISCIISNNVFYHQ